MSDVVKIEDLVVRFATDEGSVLAVDGVSLAVGEREVLAIVGESGSGKTVTARAILGLLPETATTRGAVVLRGRDSSDGVDVLSLSPGQLRQVRGRDAAMVFQEPSAVLNPVYPIWWQIAEGLRAHGRLSRADARARAVEMLELVGIPDPTHRIDHFPHEFSGGQKQRIVIAMALALNPGLIIADEPTTALDVTVQAEILDLLRRLRDDFGSAIVLITHNMGVVADLADRVAVMYQGRVVEQAPVRQLFAAPQDAYTQRLLAAVPRVGAGHSQRDTPEPATANVVEAKRLVIQYPARFGSGGFTAVRGVDFHIHAGEVLGLVGESGSGKTTIGRAIAGLTPVTGGSLDVLGFEMNGVRERRFRAVRGDIGFVFQDPGTSFNPLLTIAECVAEPLIVHGRARTARDARARVDELLDAVQLPTAYGERFPHELSGGQRQRVSFARALALSPSLVVLDEPTSALDVSVQARVLELFGELQRQFGFAALFISHDLAVVDQLATRIAVMRNGEIIETGPNSQVLGSPQHAYTRRLLASLPVPDPDAQAERRDALRALGD
ncbi:ABC transporter ATP-binding protein [Gryllotalpicola sp.]|uniref:dipeptide ABC transporter ATP-binding protein n=1 Tax=Gryllotalpicola sp. TaxID=1932787 RepID=UPI00260AC909|nr:ABC transporter ATP-binding protein [Gryllotalpicola sp.]